MGYKFEDKAAADAAFTEMFEKHPPTVTVDMTAGAPEGMSDEEFFFSDDADYADNTESLYDDLIDLVPPRLRQLSGEVFMSGRTAFDQPSSPLYILGFNPGGKPEQHGDLTIEVDLAKSRSAERHDWSFADDQWGQFGGGALRFQNRLRFLIEKCGLDPRRVPVSNAAFVRSARVATLDPSLTAKVLLNDCWPVHQRVIEGLGVRVVVCLGGDAGWWVRKQLGAHTEAEDPFIEENKRRWRSTVYRNGDGLQVVTLSHPSVADWTKPHTNPTGLVLRALATAQTLAD